MNIERGVPYYPSTYFYNPFYQFPPAQTLPFVNEKENGTAAAKFCLACAEGLYCAVAASFVAFPSASYEQSPQQFCNESSSDGINSGQSGSTESHLSNDSSVTKREIQKEIAAVNAAAIASAASSSQLAIPEQHHHEEFKEVYIKHEPCSSSHQYQPYLIVPPKQRRERKAPQNNKIIPTLDENGIRKRYSRFRSKNHVCDFCNKSFTLKQNVQTHMSLYHMTSEPVHRPAAVRKTIRKRQPAHQQQ